MRWGVERRLEFLEYRIYWEGRFNRGSLVDEFGISVPQASNDIRRYEELAPGNITYDAPAKAFCALPDFRPAFYRPSADRYLAQLRALADGVVERDELMVGRPPAYDIVPTIHRRLDDDVVRAILSAIRTRAAILVTYQSFSSPQVRERWLAPHAIAFDGQRWHARAWCCERKRFRDFALGRMSHISGQRPAADEGAVRDEEWERRVTFVLAPHPGLSAGMRRAVETDYDMSDGSLKVEVRAALAYYLYKQLGLYRDPSVTPAEEYHVVLLNPDEIERAMHGSDDFQTGAAEA